MVISARTGKIFEGKRAITRRAHSLLSLGYLEQGLLVRDSNKLLLNYLRGWHLKLDLAALIPTDLFYLVTGVECHERIPCPGDTLTLRHARNQ